MRPIVIVLLSVFLASCGPGQGKMLKEPSQWEGRQVNVSGKAGPQADVQPLGWYAVILGEGQDRIPVIVKKRAKEGEATSVSGTFFYTQSVLGQALPDDFSHLKTFLEKSAHLNQADADLTAGGVINALQALDWKGPLLFVWERS